MEEQIRSFIERRTDLTLFNYKIRKKANFIAIVFISYSISSFIRDLFYYITSDQTISISNILNYLGILFIGVFARISSIKYSAKINLDIVDWKWNQGKRAFAIGFFGLLFLVNSYNYESQNMRVVITISNTLIIIFGVITLYTFFKPKLVLSSLWTSLATLCIFITILLFNFGFSIFEIYSNSLISKIYSFIILIITFQLIISPIRDIANYNLNVFQRLILFFIPPKSIFPNFNNDLKIPDKSSKIKEVLKNKIADNFEEALTNLSIEVQESSKIQDDIIILRRRYKDIQNNYLKGLLTQEAQNVELNKLRYNYIQLVSNIEESDLKPNNTLKEQLLNDDSLKLSILKFDPIFLSYTGLDFLILLEPMLIELEKKWKIIILNCIFLLEQFKSFLTTK